MSARAAAPTTVTGFLASVPEARRSDVQRLHKLNRKTAPAKLELYDVRNDVGEANEVSAEHPEIVKRLLALADRTRHEIGDADQDGPGQRPAGHVENPQPLLLGKSTR